MSYDRILAAKDTERQGETAPLEHDDEEPANDCTSNRIRVQLTYTSD